MTEREDPQRADDDFVRGGGDTADRSGHYADHDVIRTPHHAWRIRATRRRTIQPSDVTLAGAEALVAFAREFAQGLLPGDTVALEGGLGAGKTTFVRGLAEGLGSGDDVSSPTFVFRQRYGGTVPIEHLDLYRIDDASELPELGLEEAFGEDAVTVVEWADRCPELLPPDAIRVRITGVGNLPRRIVVTP